MAVESEADSITRQRSNGPRRDNWGARDSLRKSLGNGQDKMTDDEITPLLGSASGSESGEGRIEGEWEGHADFIGLSKWKKPTVGLGQTVPAYRD